VTDAVSVAFGTDVDVLRSAERRRESGVALARGVSLYLARHEAGAPLASIAEWLGYRSYNSAATALTRFRARIMEPELRRKLRQARALLYKVET